MKLFRITRHYPAYLKAFYDVHPGLADSSYAEQKKALDYDAFGWADYWSSALTPMGYEVFEAAYNVEPLQRKWAEENLADHAAKDLRDIVVAQVKKFKPDVLWFDDDNRQLLLRIRSEVPSIRVVLGWVGSAIPQSDVWGDIDLVLSCAPESVSWMQARGVPSAHLHHGFDPRVLDRLVEREREVKISFVGQLVRASQFHLQREQLLEKLAGKINLTIFSPSQSYTARDEIKAVIMGAAYDIINATRKVGIPDDVYRGLPAFRKAIHFDARPLLPMNRKLKPYVQPAVFGLEMFQCLRDSAITLNIHADSSPLFASNMRLFEITGVGTCMVADWKQNLPELFDIDNEVVTYRSTEECVEKVQWLVDHPADRERIAKAGQARTLKDHTFSRRAETLDALIRKMV